MVIDRFQVILERLAADRDPVLDDQCRLGGVERVPLDRVRGVGQLQIVNVLEVAEAPRRQRPQPVELRLLRGDPFEQVVHVLFVSRRGSQDQQQPGRDFEGLPKPGGALRRRSRNRFAKIGALAL